MHVSVSIGVCVCLFHRFMETRMAIYPKCKMILSTPYAYMHVFVSNASSHANMFWHRWRGGGFLTQKQPHSGTAQIHRINSLSEII